MAVGSLTLVVFAFRSLEVEQITDESKRQVERPLAKLLDKLPSFLICAAG